jgi:hypothetical protein
LPPALWTQNARLYASHFAAYFVCSISSPTLQLKAISAKLLLNSTAMTVTSPLVHAAAALHFRNGTEIIDFFHTRARSHFVEWFNANCANRQAWAGKAIGTTDDVKSRFRELWDNIPAMFDSDSINLLQFLALMSILINEVGQQLLPITELCGSAACPGLAYPFNNIAGVKRSYNLGQGNRQAGELFFDDPHFWEAHNHLPAADAVRASPNNKELWNGSVYPQHLFPTSLDPSQTGFIQQADFFKFRGRGFIQVTWRVNYRAIVSFVQDYEGANSTILRYKSAWQALDPDVVCTISTNKDWDVLFQETDFVIACRAIGLHNRACGNYLRLSSDPAILTTHAMAPGSFYNMGHRISGGDNYAGTFSERVAQLMNTLNYT